MSNRFWSQVLKVLSGTAVAQVVPILGSLVLARLFVPDAFGYYSTWLGLVVIGAVIATGRFEQALVQEEDGRQRSEAVLMTIVTALLGSALLGLVMAAAYWLRAPWFTDYSVPMLMAAVPTALFMAIAQVLQSWAAADGRFRHLVLMRLVFALAVTGLQVVVGFIEATASALALCQLAGAIVAVVASLWLLPVSCARGWRTDGQLAFWRKHRRFGQYSLLADTINAVVSQLPVVVVGARFGAESAGLLALTIRTMGAPISLLGTAVLDVFKRHAGESWRTTGECRREFLKTLKVLAAFSFLATGFLMLFSEQLFAFAFGQAWEKSGAIAVWLLPMFALRFVASPLSYMVYLANQQHADLAWQVALLLMTLVTLWWSADFQTAILLYASGYCAMYVIYLKMSYRFSLGVPS